MSTKLTPNPIQVQEYALAKLIPAYWLSGVLTIVALVKSVTSVFIPGIFRDPPMTAGNAQGTDFAILIIAIPILVASMILTARGSWRAQIVWLGALSYILYSSMLFAFGTAFNPLFLLYVASLSLSLWSIVVLLIRVDADGLRARFASKLPVRVFAIYILVIAAIFSFTWMRQIIPVMFESAAPAFLQGTIMLTNPVHVVDLGFALPLSVLGAVWLWQRKVWGYLISGVMLSMMTIETASIAIDQVFGHLNDPTASLDAVPLFAVLTLVGLVVVVAYLRYLHLEPDQRVRG